MQYVQYETALPQACDHVSFPVVFFSVCGNVCICLAMMLIGPAPFFPADVLPPSVPLIYAAMVLEGLAYAFNMVSTFSRAGNAAKRLGYRDDINTYLMVTGKNLEKEKKEPPKPVIATTPPIRAFEL